MSNRTAYVVAALVGLSIYVLVYGWGHVTGTSTYWELPTVDERMALMGYRYFLHEPWHWPVFVSHAVNVPYPKSVAFLDCIPIWALANKSVATLVPAWTDVSARVYLPLWHALAYALQPVFGVAILRTLGHRAWRETLIVAAFFVAIPAWIARYGHVGLSAHWIELWALLLYLRIGGQRTWTRKEGIAWTAQLAFASLVTPYHVVLSLPVFVASLLRSGSRRTLAIWLPLALVSVAACLWFAGYFAAEGRRAQWGFDHESTNALSWLVPMRSGILGEASWLPNVDATGFQYEGYTYLGLGLLTLLVALVLRRALSIRTVVRRHVVLFAVLISMSIVALSNHIYVGSYDLLAYPIPRFLKWFAEQYRSPGRFVWIPMYVVACFVLHRALTTFASGRAFVILVVACAVQLVDVTGDWDYHQKFTSAPGYVLGNHQAWRRLLLPHARVLVLPTYSCVFGDYGLPLDHASMEIQWLASERAMPINGTYATRARRRCATEARAWADMKLEPGTLYVTLPHATALAERFEATGAFCGAFAFGRACSTNYAAIAEAKAVGLLQPVPSPIAFEYGTPVLMKDLPVNAVWTSPESEGRWTAEAVASLLIELRGAARAEPVLKLQARAPLCEKRSTQDVDVRINSQLVTTLHFDETSNSTTDVRELRLNVPPAVLQQPFTLAFVPRDVRSLATLRCGDETRRLGVWVSRLSFE